MVSRYRDICHVTHDYATSHVVASSRSSPFPRDSPLRLPISSTRRLRRPRRPIGWAPLPPWGTRPFPLPPNPPPLPPRVVVMTGLTSFPPRPPAPSPSTSDPDGTDLDAPPAHSLPPSPGPSPRLDGSRPRHAPPREEQERVPSRDSLPASRLPPRTRRDCPGSRSTLHHSPPRGRGCDRDRDRDRGCGRGRSCGCGCGCGRRLRRLRRRRPSPSPAPRAPRTIIASGCHLGVFGPHDDDDDGDDDDHGRRLVVGV